MRQFLTQFLTVHAGLMDLLETDEEISDFSRSLAALRMAKRKEVEP